jgi:hypothetical protein
MTSPDPIQSAVAGIAKEAISAFLKQAEDFLAAATGQEGKSIGTMLGNLFHRRRGNAVKVLSKAEALRIDAGIPITEILLRIVQPALDGASLEDDPDVQLKWASLLANAADPREAIPVSPMFPGILRDLGHREVKFLDALYDQCLEKASTSMLLKRVSQFIFQQDDLKDLFVALGFSKAPKLSSPTFDEQQHVFFQHDQNAFYLLLDVIRNHDVIREQILPNQPQAPPLSPGQHIYHFTELGAAFVLACRPPRKD